MGLEQLKSRISASLPAEGRKFYVCLFSESGPFPQGRIQNPFADTQAFRCDFQKFIGFNKFQRLFQT